ncbi:MAG: thrombospondin type 3 repeat-containing protein, partial [Pseudomonadota bacterium]
PDGDGISRSLDNCLDAANADQRDTDGDGFGNVCDGDFNADCRINFEDLGIMKEFMFSSNAETDLDGDGAVNFLDVGLLKSIFFQPPGPSGVPNACTP